MNPIVLTSYTNDEVVKRLKEYLLINISNFKFTNDESLIDYINEVLADLYSEFELNTEEAIIVVPDNKTKVFDLSSKFYCYDKDITDDKLFEANDKNVILGFFTQKMNKSLNNNTQNKYIENIKNIEGLI